eukprot:6177538-Pleurochrysis_carterae.AAC.2
MESTSGCAPELSFHAVLVPSERQNCIRDRLPTRRHEIKSVRSCSPPVDTCQQLLGQRQSNADKSGHPVTQARVAQLRLFA